MTPDNEIFYSAFFGYKNLPGSIEVGNRKLIPVKSLCLKYHGTITNSYQSNREFCVSKIRRLCEFLEIQLHRPVKGLYCVEERYLKFFDALYQFYMKESSKLRESSYFRFCFYENKELIKNMFCEVMV